TTHQAHAKAVIGADGERSFVAKAVNAQAELEEPVNRAMYYAYYKDLAWQSGPAAEFHFHGDNLVYAFPSDNNLTLIAASMPIGDFKEFKRDLEENFNKKLAFMPDLNTRIKQAQREGPIRGSGSIPGYMRIPYGPGWALVGDAAMAMDPWSGQGIDQASTHAILLAGNLNEYLAGEKDWESAMQAYHNERNEYSKKTYLRTCKNSRDLRPMVNISLQKRGLI
ncbi:MAG: FAD-dependent monooxygenase, partial [Chloroflexota bacterium]